MEGPQRMAFNTRAVITGYGGAAGGGKSALIAILAILSHHRTVIYRYDAKQLRSLIDDMIMFYGTTTGLNRQYGTFYFGDVEGHMAEWGGIGEPGSEQAWQGRAHDFIAADEVTQLSLEKLLWLKTWLRTVRPKQRCRMLWTFNPPGSEDDDTGKIPSGRWVIDFFAPWLDERHPNPADPGELRYFITDPSGQTEEVPNRDPREITLKGKVFKQIPESRTFIPATVQDNQYLRGTHYEQTLLAQPEPLRSRMLLGDFRSGIMDPPNQVIPTKWVDEAMDRWDSRGCRQAMTSMGVDVARGGMKSYTCISRRHGFWWDEIVRERGSETRDGPTVAAMCMRYNRDEAWINIDANGVGASPFDFLRKSRARVNGVMLQKTTGIKVLPGKIVCYNVRAWLYWMARLVLDPSYGFRPEIPRDNRLRADLIAPHFHITMQNKLLVESKDEIKDRLRRSTDDGDAFVLTLNNVLVEEGVSERLRPHPAPKRVTDNPEEWLEDQQGMVARSHNRPVRSDQDWMAM